MEIIRVECDGIENVKNFLSRIEEVERKTGISLLTLDESAVFGEDQIRAAVMHAERNFAEGKSVARDLKTEAMRYIACEKQISGAIKKAGIKRGMKRFVLVLYGESDRESILGSLGLRENGFIKEERDREDEVLESMALLEL